MNLTELQMQLRGIEDHISALQVEIERMKPRPEDEKKAALEKITKLAMQFPLDNKQVPEMPAVSKMAYITGLAYITLADENKLYEKLLYLCRLAYGMGLPISSEEILQRGMAVDKTSFDKMCSDLKRWRYSFLTDALVLANITAEAAAAAFSVIADMAKIMDCDKEELCFSAYVAKAVLTENMDVLSQLPVPKENRWMGQFRQHIPASWINSQRVDCGTICTEVIKSTALPKAAATGMHPLFAAALGTASSTTKRLCEIKKRLQTEAIVKRGDELIAYEKEPSPEGINIGSVTGGAVNIAAILGNALSPSTSHRTKKTLESIYAPCNGLAFFVADEERDAAKDETRKYLHVYVVSYFDNYADFREWHKKQRE